MTSNLESDKLRVLLCEYGALRDEVLQRDTSLNQFLILAGIATVAVGALMLNYSVSLGIVLLGLVAALIFFAFKMIEHDVLEAASRLLELEDEINRRVGERLMNWESTHGLHKVGYRNRLRYVLQSYLRVASLGFWKLSH
jgi:hypothetical protein